MLGYTRVYNYKRVSRMQIVGAMFSWGWYNALIPLSNGRLARCIDV